jgi:phospholipase C
MVETRRSALGGIARVAAPAIIAAVLVAAACSGSKGDPGPAGPAGPGASPDGGSDAGVDPAATLTTATPIKHLVVIFNENISFDHYFATYPANPPNDGGPSLNIPADGGTLAANGLTTPLDVDGGFAPLTGVDLMNNNPNLTNTAVNGANASNPIRLNPSQAVTNDQGHNYKPEQQASNKGLMDSFPAFTGTAGPPPGAPTPTGKALVMGFYDGNTVTALWNYAQNFAMNDNSWSTVFGPSTPGAINLISGQTNGMTSPNKPNFVGFAATHAVADGQGGFTMIGDTDPFNDVCSTASDQNLMSGKNVGDLLNTAGISWGAFMGGFDLTMTNANGTFGCNRLTNPTAPGAAPTASSTDYIAHHAWFQYYASTANPTHARPSSIAAIGASKKADGTAEPANHNYDSHDFFDTLKAGNLPAVNFVKPPAFQDGHAGYSNPLDEQAFLVSVINALQESPFWASTAVIIAYDDSDGWYDHQGPPIVNPSSLAAIGTPAAGFTLAAGGADQLNGDNVCNSGIQQGKAVPGTALLGVAGKPVLGRCGYGTRQPLLVISPFAKKNFIDHTLTDQTSILRFIEDNWLQGARIQAGGSFDTIANPITNMLSFPAGANLIDPKSIETRKVYLDPESGVQAIR